jgi:hypothetical protein
LAPHTAAEHAVNEISRAGSASSRAAQRRAQIVEIVGVALAQQRQRHAPPRLADRAEEGEHRAQVALGGGLGLAGFLQLLERERASAFEQAVARGLSRVCHDERLVDQRAEQVDDGPCVDLFGGRDVLRALEVEGADHDAETAEHRALVHRRAAGASQGAARTVRSVGVRSRCSLRRGDLAPGHCTGRNAPAERVTATTQNV